MRLNSTAGFIRAAQCRWNVSVPRPARQENQILKAIQCRHSSTKPSTLTIGNKTYPTDSWTNIPDSILDALPRRLHLQPNNPISLTRRLIESHFPSPTYTHHNTLSPIVSVAQNFDSLGFPLHHPGRSRTDTYYINAATLLRTHTSAHQAATFALNASPGFLISADVYRRDAIDRSHYPIFHQMEGARMWDRRKVLGGDIAKAVWADLETLPTHSMQVSDPNPTIDRYRNPLQATHHTQEEVEALAAHLKRSIEAVVLDIFTQARLASLSTTPSAKSSSSSSIATSEEPLQIRWIEAYFPFTSPSWELEVLWQGTWLELLGCGIVQQALPINAGVPHQVGWAFGLGLERIAMLLFGIPDIRLFWSKDKRFLSQFGESARGLDGVEKRAGVSAGGGKSEGIRDWGIKRFVPFSKYPASSRDVAFWLPRTSSPTSSNPNSPFHENDVMEIIRDIGGDLVEDVQMVDDFVQKGTGRKSLCYRIVYRSLEMTLKGEDVSHLHARVGEELVRRLGVALR
ncbi:MAG: hypothetical protein M1835_003584 [Candelina submexicana]|nr:MAG: hypothetical protein M1835_003584 [Candelina submexicana]